MQEDIRKGIALAVITGALAACAGPAQFASPEINFSQPEGQPPPSEQQTQDEKTNPEKLLRLAKDLEAHGENAAAMALYEQAAAASQSPAVHLMLADACMRANKLDKAIAAYRTVITKEPSNSQGLGGLGAALMRQGEFEQGISALKAAAQIDDNATSYSRLGVAYAMAGEFDRAEAAFSEALAKAPNDLDTGVNLALVMALGEHYDKAIELMQKVTAAPRADSRHRRHLVLVLALAGRAKEARAAAPRETPANKVDAIIDRADLIREKTSPKARARALGFSFARPETAETKGKKREDDPGKRTPNQAS